MKTKTSRILAVVLIFQLLAFSACAGWLIYDAKVDRSGWAEKDGVRFYRDFHAKPVTGWLVLFSILRGLLGIIHIDAV